MNYNYYDRYLQMMKLCNLTYPQDLFSKIIICFLRHLHRFKYENSDNERIILDALIIATEDHVIGRGFKYDDDD